MIATLTLFLIVPLKVLCFNLDTNFPIVYVDPYRYLPIPTTKSSYFGYSLVLYPGDRTNAPWIQIGAPRGNNPTVEFDSPGAAFKCRIGARCTLLDFDLSKTAFKTNGRSINKLDNAWIGGSMDINHKNERVVTCGFRSWVHRIGINRKNDDFQLRGSCYWSHVNDNSTQELWPISGSEDIHQENGNVFYYYAQGESGFSVHMPSKTEEMILGAPGVLNWGGTVVAYRDGTESPPIANKLLRNKRYASSLEFGESQIITPLYIVELNQNDYFGYSLTSGYFYSTTELLYVSAGPKAKDYRGQVLVHGFYKGVNTKLNISETKIGTQIGEYFGASLTAGDIDNDGLDDLVVGAPFYSTGKYNEGRIYVFLGSSKRRLQAPVQGEIIAGRSPGGQFGATVQFLGDINHDSYGDLAVASPYEEIGGVVYIFRGTKRGLDVVPCQRIVGRDISQEIRGFGISISRPADIDYNSYEDIAIGAYKSGHAVLLRSRPAVMIHHSLETFQSPLDYNQKSFQIRACFWFSLDQSDYEAKVNRILAVDELISRASLVGSSYTEVLTLAPDITTCQNFTINLKKQFVNHYDPISLTLSHEFVTEEPPKDVIFVGENINGTDRFCPRCPVYDKFRSSDPATVNVPFALGCGTDNICHANLALNSKFVGLATNDTFILGSAAYVKLETTIQNTGEKAYLTQIVVTLPEAINFRQIPAFCVEHNISVVSCSVDNPLDQNAAKVVNLDLDMNNVNSGKYEEYLVVKIKVQTSSESNNQDDTINVKLKLKREADVTITGKSDEQSYSYGNVTIGMANFTQTYQVQKVGVSPVDEVQIEIDIPYAIEYSSGATINFLSLYPLRGALAGQPLTCKSDFIYIVENRRTSDMNAVEENQYSDRRKRSLDNNERDDMVATQDVLLLQNRTFYINCSTPGVICSKAVCIAGPFKSKQHIAVVDIKMSFDVSRISSILKAKDVILFTTQGSVTIQRPTNFAQSGDLPDNVFVSSIFIGEVKPKIALWIIIVSAIGGFLLLALIILALVKAGFFKRTKREELQQLKQELDNQEQTDNEEEHLAKSEKDEIS